MTPDTLVRHRDKPDLRLDDDNAFQSIGGFIPSEDLKSERIERHLEWQRKVDPTSYVSAFNNLSKSCKLYPGTQLTKGR